jgi:hypothetical protein
VLRDEVIGVWRKLHNEELYNLYSSPSIRVLRMSNEDNMGMACSRHREEAECISNFGGKAGRKESTRKNNM